MIRLSDKDTSLRALEPGDIDLLVKWENDPNFWEVSDRVTPLSKDLLERYLDNSHLDLFAAGQFRFVITEKGHPVGTIDLFDLHPIHRRVGIGILIADTKDRGKGTAGRALDLLTDYCFQGLNLNCIWCYIGVENRSSISLFERSGYRLAGTLKQWVHSEGGYKDVLIYQRLKGDA